MAAGARVQQSGSESGDGPRLRHAGRRSGRRNVRLRSLCALALLAPALQAPAQPAVSGYLEYQGRGETREEQGNSYVNLVTVRADASTPLGESWIADLTAGVGLTFSETSQDALSQTGSDVTGNARLRVLPRSRIPFEAFVERRNSQVDGELAGPNYSQTVYGFSQAFLPSPAERYALTYQHTDRDDERPDQTPPLSHTRDDFVSLAMNRTFSSHQLDFHSDHDRIERDNPLQSDRRDVNVLRHRYTPDTSLSVDNMVSLVDSRVQSDSSGTGSKQNQATSSLFWRPATAKPLLVTGSVLASGFESSTDEAQSESRLFLLSAGANYQVTAALSARASASYSENHILFSDVRSSLVKSGLTWSPGDVALGGWSYRYAVSGDIGSRSDTATGDVQEGVATFSHGASRNGRLWGGTRGISLTQELSALHDTIGRNEDRLVHTAAVDWSTLGDSSSAYVRAFASDNRRIDGENTGFQMVNLQASGTQQVSRFSSWNGSLTGQMTRNVAPGVSSPWTSSASADITYRHEKVFGVPLLRFSSQLRVLTDDLIIALNDRIATERKETASWTNRLDYTVGRTQLTLRAAVTEVDGKRYGLLHFQLRRFFGALPR